jgi:hypothetical protein
MSVKFLSHADQSEFSQMLYGDSELKEFFPLFMTHLELETNYDTVMVSFDGDILRAAIEDSPFLLEFDEGNQSLSLEKLDSDSYEYHIIEEWDFDEDAVEEVVDFIRGQVLEDEQYVT